MKLNLSRDIKKVHRFEVFGKKFVMDCSSCKCYEADNITYDILQLAESDLKQLEIMHKLETKYNKKDIQLSLERLKQLKSTGKLFTNDPYPGNGIPPTAIGAIALNVSHACNLRCDYCFGCWPENVDNYVGSGKIMTDEVAKKSAEWAYNAGNNDPNFNTSFFGGEPLLAIPAIKTYLNKMKELYFENDRKGVINFGATTNCTTLTEEVQNFLLKEGISYIIASIDGHKEMHDAHRRYPNGKSSYNDAIKNLKSYQKKGGTFTARGTYMKDTVDDFCKGIFSLADHGFTSISMEQGYMNYDSPLALKAKEIKIAKKQYDIFIKKYLQRLINDKFFHFFHFNNVLKKIHQVKIIRANRECGAGSGYVTISPEGDIYPCHKFVGNPKYKMGNVFQGITKPEVGVRLWNNYVNSKEKCKKCWAKYICGGSCHADGESVNNDIAKPIEETCELMKYRYKLGVWLYSELELKKPEMLIKEYGNIKPLKNTKPKQCEGVESIRKSDDTTILNDPVRRKQIDITPSDALIWHCCDGNHSVSEIADIISEICSTGKFGLADDVKNTAHYLKSEGFLQW